ncbi:MAG: type II toxin-antitoxin system HicB family antitoxin [Gemmatimonadota bacterium]
MTKPLDFYLLLPYSVHTVPDECVDGTACYVARIPELPGCESHGATPEEAITNLREAQELFLQDMLQRGLEPPLPDVADTGSGGLTATWRVERGSGAAVAVPITEPAWVRGAIETV